MVDFSITLPYSQIGGSSPDDNFYGSHGRPSEHCKSKNNFSASEVVGHLIALQIDLASLCKVIKAAYPRLRQFVAAASNDLL